MNEAEIKAVRRIAADYRRELKERPDARNTDYSKGWVMISLPAGAFGWELIDEPEPRKYVAGVIAVSASGRVIEALDGSDMDGAERWEQLAEDLAVALYLREADSEMWIYSVDPVSMTPDYSDDLVSFPSLDSARKAHEAICGGGIRMEAVAACKGGFSAGVVVASFDPIQQVDETPIRGAVELFAALKKSSKYHGQFPGWQKVRTIKTPEWGDAYCFNVAHNAYRHEDLIFGVKLPGGEIVRLDKWVAKPAERKVAA